VRENAPVSDLIDTTEMYLRTVFELEEEGVVPLRAGSPSGWASPARPCRRRWPGWSATGLLTVEGDRHLELSAHGRTWRPG
jgi:DtxR family Mn-dependent transcriptional regulator